MKLVCLVFVVVLLSCATGVKKERNSETLDSLSPDSRTIDVDCMEDSIVKFFVEKGKTTVLLEEARLKPDILFSSGYSDSSSFTTYQFLISGNRFEFTDTIFQRNMSSTTIRSVHVNGKQLDICRVKNDMFPLDSMDMHIVYSESEFYTFKNNPYYLVVISHPMNWVGTMTQYSFFQVINRKANSVSEFIRKS